MKYPILLALLAASSAHADPLGDYRNAQFQAIATCEKITAQTIQYCSGTEWDAPIAQMHAGLLGGSVSRDALNDIRAKFHLAMFAPSPAERRVAVDALRAAWTDVGR